MKIKKDVPRTFGAYYRLDIKEEEDEDGDKDTILEEEKSTFSKTLQKTISNQEPSNQESSTKIFTEPKKYMLHGVYNK
mgnify:CR=1 FL=1